MKPRLIWYDIWVGAYIDRKNSTLYFCPLPCVVFKFSIKRFVAKQSTRAACRCIQLSGKMNNDDLRQMADYFAAFARPQESSSNRPRSQSLNPRPSCGR